MEERVGRGGGYTKGRDLNGYGFEMIGCYEMRKHFKKKLLS